MPLSRTRVMNQDVVVAELVARGLIRRLPTRGHYESTLYEGTDWKRDDILTRYTLEPMTGRYIFSQMAFDDERRLNSSGFVDTTVHQAPVLRALDRHSYHSQFRDYASALARIAADADGVRRSFGIEYEVYDLNARQEDKLARLLDTLPAHVLERDGSLGSNGIEIIFMPVGAQEFVETVKKLKQFVDENNVSMCASFDSTRMAGMHITYGVSNPEASNADLQIRLNRFALATKAVGTQSAIKKLFGRDFGNYRELPGSTVARSHSNAFSCNGRPETCWECRLTDYRCDAEKMVQFFKATEVAFHRPVKAEDFVKVFEILGGDTNGI